MNTWKEDVTSLTKEFSINRGVIQGDPLFSFLFIIVIDGLNAILKGACNKLLFQSINLPNNCPPIFHLFYMDDAIFIGECDRNCILNLDRNLRCFKVTSGLKLNFHKSRVFGIFSTDPENQKVGSSTWMHGKYPSIQIFRGSIWVPTSI